ncbi:MAG: hypothetical protein KAH38_06500 [Candidatus Hydrogenedentes bacterium]|nr:hypothetical protein [Candidatus Hydrogenedentota bacterium]
MTSTITWIDHDPAARERTLRILSLFQEKESRDELGLGALRDSFSDALFPGTNTIQTRLRYMLFIPWTYTNLEKKKIPTEKFSAKARRIEMDLVAPLLENEDNGGVFGKMAGNNLKRLPSSVYWSGLGAWGIRQINCSQQEYHRHIDDIYRRRNLTRDCLEDDADTLVQTHTWHTKVPPPPKGFPGKIKKLSFDLEVEEARFLLDRLRLSQGDSLLTWLALKSKPVDCAFPWEHPDYKRFSKEQRQLLDYGKFFSTLMHGAAFLYNLMLAELADRKELVVTHRKNLEDWRSRFKACHPAALPLKGLWEITEGRGHTITRQTRTFVQAWHSRVVATRGRVLNDKESRRMVENREKQLKGARSRFVNARARDQWSGEAGTRQLSYRWSGVQILLADLYAGLKKGNHAES